MQEQAPHAFGRRHLMARLRIWLNIGVVHERLAVLDAREGIADIRFACADGFDFAAFQFNPGFVALKDVKVAKHDATRDQAAPSGEFFNSSKVSLPAMISLSAISVREDFGVASTSGRW